MADYYWARIYIGGTVPSSLLKNLYEEIISEFEADEVQRKPKAQKYKVWFRHQMSDGLLRFESSTATYGMFQGLETYLKDHGIPFKRVSDSCGEVVPEVSYYDGSVTVTQQTDQDHNPTVTVQDMKDWCKRAVELHQEFLKGNAPLHLDANPQESTIDGLMAKFSLSLPNEPCSAELVLSLLESQYPAIPELPPFIIKED